MKYLLLLIISGALAVSGFGQTRNVLVGTNNAVVQPTNFWSADAVNARTGLGLGTAATNPATAFQPSSATLSNLATANGGSLTNLQAASLIGLIPASNIPSVTFTNIAGVLAVTSGGTGATNAADARQNLGSTTVGDAVFVATNAAAARTALSLGTAATSAITDFQPANANLTNLSTNNGASLTGIPILGVVNLQSNLDAKLATNGNGSGLTSLTAANINGTVALASNITGTAALATNVTGVVSLANGGTGSTNAASARTALGATTAGSGLFTLINPSAVSFLRINADNTSSALNASDFRLAIGLGTAATNASTAFQPSSSSLTNLSANDGSGLSNIAISGVSGLQTALDGKLSTSATATLATNVTGTVALANGGTGATNASGARTALGASTVGDNLFTLINPSAIRFLRLNADNTATALSASDFRTAIGLSTAATNAESAFQPASTNLTTLAGNNGANLTNIPLSGVLGALATNGSAAGLTGFVGTTNAATARTNLGLGWSALTNTDSTSFRNTIGLGTTNNVTFNSIQAGQAASSIVYTLAFGQTNTGFRGIGGGPNDFGFYRDGSTIWTASGSGLGVSVTATFSQPLQLNYGAGGSAYISFIGADPATGAAISRTNLGLPWSGLTNTNAATFQTALFGANTNPVLVDTNGEVLSPTNFWQAAPITTTFIESQPTTNSTTNITAARFLHIHSLNTNIFNVTNTIALPTNGSTYNGDVALVVHQGPTNSTTQVRAVGSTNNIATMTRENEAIEFVYYNNAWTFNHNEAFTEPVYFAGTNALGHAAESRTNLGLGATWLTNTNVTNFRTAIELGATNNVTFSNVTASGTLTATGAVTFVTNLSVGGAIAVTNAAETRTNLGIPLAALTNTSNTSFQAAVFTTNAAPTNTANVNGVGFNTAVGWMDVTLNIGGTNQVFRIPLFQ